MKDNLTSQILTFDDKISFFSYDYLKCCNYLRSIDPREDVLNKSFYARLITSSQIIEDFLDFHGAKNNSDWYFYRELSAAMRHLSIGSYSQKHSANRLEFYDLNNTENFKKEGEKTLSFLIQSLHLVAPAIIAEAYRLKIQVPDETFTHNDFPEITTNEILKFNIDDQNIDQQKKNIVKIASEFLSIADAFDQMEFYEPYDLKDILTIVPHKVNEVEIRRYEMLVHNLQSSFDTYVIHGGYRFGERKLKQLRGHFSIVFHLLQIMGRLLHFYERHLHKAGYKNIYKKVQEALANMVDSDRLLDRTINFGLYYACHFLTEGKNLAKEILNENIERFKITVSIPMKLGFHSRPSLLVAKIVQHYGGQVEMVVGQDRFDASSVLDIQWAGGKVQKENIKTVVFEGDKRALNDIEILASVNYGEDTMGKGVPLPEALNYLK